MARKKNKAESAAEEVAAPPENENEGAAPAEAEAEASVEAAPEAAPEFGSAEFLKDDDDDLDAPADASPDASAPEGKVEPIAPEAKPEEPPETVPEEQKAEAKPSPEPATEAPPETQPAKVETPPEQVPPETPPEVPPVAAELTPKQLEERYASWRSDTEGVLANQYALTEEMAEELDTDAGKAIPRLMARVYVDAVTATVGHIVSNMPALLEVALAKRSNNEGAEAAFFEAWPQLNAAEHKETVSRFGVSYRQLYPTATREQFIRDVGAQSMVALRIPVEPAPAAEPEAEPIAVAVAPFRPAASTAPGGGTQPPKNPFTAISDTFEDEELDLD